jgi:hypothetical protein
MRKTLLTLLGLAALAAPAPAAAHDGPTTHGPDPVAIDRGPVEAPRARAASWCGEERTADDTQNELDNGAHRFHAVYAIPSDRPSRLRTEAPAIQRDAFAASALIEREYGRSIRYDLGTACGPQYLDITVVRLPQTTADMEALAATANGTIDAVAAALDAQGLDVIDERDSLGEIASRTRNWLVWLDAPAPASACGQAMLYEDTTRDQRNMNNMGGKVALVFRSQSGGFCGANSVRHEVAHNLGAVVSAARNDDAGHCTDAVEDTMCNPDSPQRANGAYHALWFDYGNDDYWDPPNGQPLGWWTVNLSRFICPDATCNYPNGAPTADPPPAQDAGTTPRRAPRLRVSARRQGARWRLVIRASGSGRARVAVRCRRGRRAATVMSRRTALPRTLRSTVRCGSRPQVSAVLDRAA